MGKKFILGHLLGIFTAGVWGTTLISTKILLKDFEPVEILFFRFLIALIMFYVIFPKNDVKVTKKQDFLLSLAGLSGICFYYLFENSSLIYTFASNVSVINCLAPMLTAILAVIFFGTKEKINFNFVIGFIMSVAGVALIAYNGASIHLNPKGDILALCAAFSWAFYSILIKKLASYGLSTLFITKKTFLYGTMFMVPFIFLFDFKFALTRFLNPVNAFNMLFLGILASAVCFMAWSKTIKILGAVKSGAYLYLIPVITIITSVLILKEPLSTLLISGAILTLSGLIVSEMNFNKKYEHPKRITKR